MQLVIVAVGILALLILILRIKLPAFVALLIVSAGVGLALDMQPAAVLAAIKDGMASTLGFIAVVVGLGAMFGALLEFAGGVQAIANRLLGSMGQTRALWALGLAGMLVGIPVFFDVGFIILVPLLQQLSERTGRSPVYFATPLLAGLLVGHAFIPPTPGPLAVAELLNADLGWVIAMGLICGTPAMIVAGPLLARRFQNVALRRATALGDVAPPQQSGGTISLGHALFTILLPLVLIVGNTAGQQLLPPAPCERRWSSSDTRSLRCSSRCSTPTSRSASRVACPDNVCRRS